VPDPSPGEALTMTTADARPPAWTWMIFLFPLLILLIVTVSVYVSGYRHAKLLGESLVLIDATVVSVSKEVCGGRSRRTCYRIDLLGSLGGVDRKYRTHDVPPGRFRYTEEENGHLFVLGSQRTQKILVAPHPGNAEALKMYWSRSDPLEEFKVSSATLLAFIIFELLVVPLGFWKSTRI